MNPSEFLSHFWERSSGCASCVYLPLVVLLITAFGISLYIFRRFKARPLDERLVMALLAPSALIFLSEIFYRLFAAIYDEHSWIRLEKTFVLAMGEPLYHGLHDGPALATMYGPVSTLAYLPAVFFHSPVAIMAAAQFIAIAFVYLPAAWLHLGNNTKNSRDRSLALLAFFCFAAISIRLTSLRAGIFLVHADAPTLGLGALACACIYFRNQESTWKSLAASALFSVLAVWSKQVAFPLIPAIALYLGLAEGRSSVKNYLSHVFILGTAFTVVFCAVFGAVPMFIQMFYIPSRHALKPGGWETFWKSFSRLTREWLIMLAWGIFSIGSRILDRSAFQNFRQWVRLNPWFLFCITALCMFPVSILANLKVGGSNNTLCHTNYFLLLATTLAFLAPQPATEIRTRRRKIFSPAHVLAAMGVITLCVNTPFLVYRIHKTSKAYNFASKAYEYARQNPGKAYFPRLTMVHILAEGKVYHTVDGLMDRYWAGYPVTGKHLRDFIPQNAEMIVFHGEDHRWLLDLPEFRKKPVKSDDMPEADIYLRRQT